MPIKTRKPRNSSLRFQTFLDNSGLTKKAPEKSLTKELKKTGGRNSYGRITSRHRGGGAVKKYRIVDFKRIERNIPGRVVAAEYDPNRNVPLALVVFRNGMKRYILMPHKVKVGDQVVAGEDVEIKEGNCLPLRKIPTGFFLHNVELRPGQGGIIARGAGTSVQLIAKGDEYATLRMPSTEVRLIHLDCWATIGELGNHDYKNISLGKAGRTRYLGQRPCTRGMARNPVDHPHGGGEGKSKSGSHPVTPWGKKTKGMRTRKRPHPLRIQRRKTKHGSN
jgi:large subunit ribosomal protein L2